MCIGIIIFIGIVVSSIVSFSIVNTNEYTSSNITGTEKQYFPIDKYKYDEKSEDFYYYKEVKIGKAYWFGSCSYKDFAAKNNMVDLVEERTDSTVFMNYYFLCDKNGNRIKEFKKKMAWYDVFSISDEVISEYQQDDFIVYEYEDSFECFAFDDKEAFYLSASKNKRTKYNSDDVLNISKETLIKLRECA